MWDSLTIYTSWYSSMENGVSERRNRTLLDMVRSMMNHVDLPTSFRGHALDIIAFTLNRVPSKSVQSMPYEMWTRKRLNMSFTKFWGCEAYVIGEFNFFRCTMRCTDDLTTLYLFPPLGYLQFWSFKFFIFILWPLKNLNIYTNTTTLFIFLQFSPYFKLIRHVWLLDSTSFSILQPSLSLIIYLILLRIYHILFRTMGFWECYISLLPLIKISSSNFPHLDNQFLLFFNWTLSFFLSLLTYFIDHLLYFLF